MQRGRTKANINPTGLPEGTPVAQCSNCTGQVVTLMRTHAQSGANAACEHCGAYYFATLRVSLTPVVSRSAPRPTLSVDAIREATAAQLGEGHVALLTRVVRLRRKEAHRLNADGLRLVDRAIFSALTDCIDAGLGDQARAVLRSARLRVGSAPVRGR